MLKNIKFADLELCLIDFPSIVFSIKRAEMCLKNHHSKG